MLGGDAIRLEAVCEMALGFAPYRNQLGLLHNAIYMAAAQKQLQGPEAGCSALAGALEIGQADGIVLPFAENGRYILDLLEQIAGEGRFDPAYGAPAGLRKSLPQAGGKPEFQQDCAHGPGEGDPGPAGARLQARGDRGAAVYLGDDGAHHIKNIYQNWK